MTDNKDSGVLDILMVKARKYSELILSALLFFFFLGMRLSIGSFMNLEVKRWRFVSPAFWPGWILLAGAVLAGFYLYHSYKNLRKEEAEAKKTADEEDLLEKGTAQEKEAILRNRLQTEGRVLSLKELEALAEAKTKQEEGKATPRELIRTVTVIALTFIYLYSIRFTGFIASTAIFSVLYLLLLKERRPLVLIISPVAIVTVILLIFTRVLVVPLPRGIGFFFDISHFFY